MYKLQQDLHVSLLLGRQFLVIFHSEEHTNNLVLCNAHARNCQGKYNNNNKKQVENTG